MPVTTATAVPRVLTAGASRQVLHVRCFTSGAGAVLLGYLKIGVQDSRNASDGSIREARRAGSVAAMTTTVTTTRTPALKLTVSSGATP